MSGDGSIPVRAEAVAELVAQLFMSAGVSETAATAVAAGLVEADLSGLASHGVMLTDMYVGRLRAGSVSTQETATVVSDRDAVLVLDAGHALGQLTGDQAMSLAVGKARQYGVGLAAVRHGFHFGTARRFAEQAAAADCVGIVICNTRPLMPAPGGAEAVVGNNPLAIAIPTRSPIPLVLDMATSEAAMGKIRIAAKTGRPIPPTWAVDSEGVPTTDPSEAIKGMLLPAAGPKGFGLAFVFDLLAGLLSGGAFGAGVRPLYGDMAQPYDCSHLFIAIDLCHFGDPALMRETVAAAADRLRSGKRAPGVERLYAPGEPEWVRREQAAGKLRLPRTTVDMLGKLAAEAGLDASSVFGTNQ